VYTKVGVASAYYSSLAMLSPEEGNLESELKSRNADRSVTEKKVAK
jgi:hypothetical protein